jgi:DNA polymerase Ligase (LigD)
MTAGQRLWMGGLIKEGLGMGKLMPNLMSRISRPFFGGGASPRLLFRGHQFLEPFHPRGWGHATALPQEAAMYGRSLNPNEKLVGIYRSHPEQQYYRPDDLTRVRTGNLIGKTQMPTGQNFPVAQQSFQEQAAQHRQWNETPNQAIQTHLNYGDVGQLYETPVEPGMNKFLGWGAFNPVTQQMRRIAPEELQQLQKIPGMLGPIKAASVRLLFSYLVKQADEAVGIPRRGDYGDLSQVKPGDLLDYVIQRHKARVRGEHLDLRAGRPGTGLYSWVARKEDWPLEPGQRATVIPTSVHKYKYKDFEGTIPGTVYGAGTVKKEKEGQLLITKTTPNSIHFSEASGQVVKRYALIRPGGPKDPWILVRANHPELPGVDKQNYKLIKPEEADLILKQLMEEGAVVQPKVDGALSFIRLAKGRAEILSHRTSKRTGGAIPHTERFFGQIPDVKYPKEYEGSTLLGELYGERGGEAIPPQELGGILNASIGRSLQKQKEQDVKLKMLLFGLSRPGEKPFDRPYPEQRQAVEDIMQYLPDGDRFMLPEEATTYEDAVKMLEQIQSGKHPLTREGIIVHPTKGGVPKKIKFRPEEDVYIRDVFPGEGKYQGTGAGGFRYSYEPEGPIVGRVGSGLSDELRRELISNPEAYIGRIARVAAQQRFPSGALRAPSLLALHEG